MVLTRASQQMRTRSQGKVRESQLIELPAKRRQAIRDEKTGDEATQQAQYRQTDADEGKASKRSAYTCHFGA